MSNPRQKPLVTAGPFKGLDATRADPYITPGNGVQFNGCDANVVNGALTCARGRAPAINFAPVLPGATAVGSIFGYDSLPTQTLYFGQGVGSSEVGLFSNPLTTGSASTTLYGIGYYTEAVQFGDSMYFNNGVQFRGNYPNSTGPAPAFYTWQYPPPTGVGAGLITVTPTSGALHTTTTTASITVPPLFGTVTVPVSSGANFPNGTHISIVLANSLEGYVISGGGTTSLVVMVTNPDSNYGATIASGAGVSSFMAGGVTYYYAVTNVYNSTAFYTAPDYGGVVNQETTAYGQYYPYPLTYNSPASPSAGYVTLFGPFSGTSSDGVPYTSNIYRYSSSAPQFQLVASGVTGTTYVDVVDDNFIAGNAALVPRRDPPPCCPLTSVSAPPVQVCPIESHKDRMWCATVTSSANTNNRPQCQVWYSNVGRGWEFDAINQVLLCGEEDTPSQPIVQNTTGAQTDVPVRLVSLSGLLVLLKRRTSWTILGDDESDFIPRKLFDIGCVAELSPAKSEGAMFWLSEQGVFMFDGSSGPQYLSEDIRGALDAIPASTKTQAVGFFQNRTYYLSIPFDSTTNYPGTTYAYYTVSQEWRELPYYTTSAWYIPAREQYTYSTPYPTYFGEVLTTHGLGFPFQVDAWNASINDYYYRGTIPIMYFQTPNSSGGEPQWQKIYRYISIEAPYQPGVTVTVTLNIDPGYPNSAYVPPVTFDLGTGAIFQAQAINGARGTYANFIADVTVNSSTVQPIIWRITVWGNPDRELILNG